MTHKVYVYRFNSINFVTISTHKYGKKVNKISMIISYETIPLQQLHIFVAYPITIKLKEVIIKSCFYRSHKLKACELF